MQCLVNALKGTLKCFKEKKSRFLVGERFRSYKNVIISKFQKIRPISLLFLKNAMPTKETT